MYNANLSYDENYRRGPDPSLVRDKRFPRLRFPGEPRFSLLGIPLHLPFGFAAGPLLNSEYVRVAAEAGFCFSSYRTVRSRSAASLPWPNVLVVGESKSVSSASAEVVGLPFENSDYRNRDSLSLSNSFGVPSKDPEEWHRDFQDSFRHQGQGQHLLLSFQGSYLPHVNPALPESFDDFVHDIALIARLAAHSARSARCSILEINLSCPNDEGGVLYKDLDRTCEVLRVATTVISAMDPGLRLIAKVGQLDVNETLPLLRAIRPFVSGVSAINTVPSPVISRDGSAVLGSGDVAGGLCGRMILERGLQVIGNLHEARRKLGLGPAELTLVGSGGVLGPLEFLKYVRAGADAVQAATGAIWNPLLASEVAEACGVRVERVRG